MGLKRNVRKIEVPTDTPTEFELGDTAADIQRRREEATRVETSQLHTDEGLAKKTRGWRSLHISVAIQAQERPFYEHLFNRLR